MFLKNTFSIFHTNLSLLFKAMLFILLLAVIFACIVVAITSPIMSTLVDLAVSETIDAIFVDWIAGDATIAESITLLVTYFQDGITSQLASYFWIMLVVVLLSKFFIGLIHLPVSHVLYNMMGLNCEVGFSNAIITHLWRSVGYSFFYGAITSVMDAIIIAAVAGIYMLLNGFMGIFAITIAILIGILLFSVRYALFSQWIPLILIDKLSVVKAFFASFKVSFVHFYKTTQSYCMILFVTFAIVATTALPTFFTTIIVAVPTFIIITCIVNLIANFVATGSKFYIDDKTIIEC